MEQPKDSVIQGIMSDESGNFIVEYMASTKHIGHLTSRYNGRLE